MMERKQLGIIGDDYNLTKSYFKKIVNNTHATKDQDNISINLIFSKNNQIYDLLKKCKYLESINTNKIVMLSNISDEDIKYLNYHLNIPVCNSNIDINDLIKEFKGGLWHVSKF